MSSWGHSIHYLAVERGDTLLRIQEKVIERALSGSANSGRSA
jgi:hypothetical protein